MKVGVDQMDEEPSNTMMPNIAVPVCLLTSRITWRQGFLIAQASKHPPLFVTERLLV